MRLHLPIALKRMRHRRGHGIHSPFVYALAREVFDRRQPAPEGELFQTLRREGFSPRHAREIERLAAHLGTEAAFTPAPDRLCIARELPAERDGTYCLLGRCGPQPGALTIDRRRYTLVFYGRPQPAQHFIL